MKRAAIQHTKMRRLMRALSIPQYAAVGILESLWHLCAREAPQGNIGKLTDADIADAIGWEREPESLIEGLTESGWIDRNVEHRLIVHDWRDHADDAVDNALTRAHLRYADGSIPRMNRLSKNERELHNTLYLQSVRTELHNMPPPEPKPEPKPEPVPVALPPVAPPRISPDLDHTDVSRRVAEECRLTSRNAVIAIEQQAKLELADGRTPDDVAAEMRAAWELYQHEKPNLKITPGAEKFFGEGMWREPKLWPRKENENGSFMGIGKGRYEAAAAEAIRQLAGS